MNLTPYQERRNRLKTEIINTTKVSQGTILLAAGLEQDSVAFQQDSTFLYFTGINEPGTVLCIDIAQGTEILFVPAYGTERAKWNSDVIHLDHDPKNYGVTELRPLGSKTHGYQLHPFFGAHEIDGLINFLNEPHRGTILACSPEHRGYETQRFFLLQLLQHWKKTPENKIRDISAIVTRLRRTKSKDEIAQLFTAINISMQAQEAAASQIKEGNSEAQVQAGLEYVMRIAGAVPSFPTIVGSGIRSTVLHYNKNSNVIGKKDLVVVDCGARFDGYCGDLTRTYPASGTFSKKQREIYNKVLEVQQLIASFAKPGIWLSNKEHPEASLNHLARAEFKKENLDTYFPHGIGHFLGLDVHDVGDYERALEPGDVITIEPGLYIPAEEIGIRIEDNYWIVPSGAICLSEDLPRTADDIEKLMAETQK